MALSKNRVYAYPCKTRYILTSVQVLPLAKAMMKDQNFEVSEVLSRSIYDFDSNLVQEYA